MKSLIIAALLLFAVGVESQSASAAKDDGVIELGLKNTYTFRGVVDSTSITQAEVALTQLDESRGSSGYPIYLVMDSPGGSIGDGLDFIAFTKTIKNLKTITIFAASMASAIVEQLPGERLVLEDGTLMFHRAKGGFQGQFEDGEVESRLKMAKTIVRNMESRNAKRIGITLELYKSKVKDEWWEIGQDSVDQKMADKVVTVKCTKELTEQTVMGSVETMFGSADVSFSGCPLLRVGKSAAAKE